MAQKTGDEELAQRIRKLRGEKGLTQRQLADLTKLAYQTVRGIESGDRFVSKDSAERLSKALGVTVKFLLSGVDDSQNLGGEETLDNLEDTPKYLTFFSNDPNISPEAKRIIEGIIRDQYATAKRNAEELKRIPEGTRRKPQKSE